MKDILVVEDSPMVVKVIKHVLKSSAQFRVHYCSNMAETRAICESGDTTFFAGMIDLNLPDAPDGEVVDYVLSKSIPTIVLTGSYDEKRRELLLSKGIVDYVTKEGKYSYNYAVSLLNRLVKNQQRKILVVDDSSTARKHVRRLLELQLFQVLEAEDGFHAVKLLVEHPDISLMVTDYNMPKMNGCELVKHIRDKYEKTDMAIIGLSSEGEGELSAKFIKHGANDFLRKPFNQEEFHCRISHNLELIDLIDVIRDASYRDDLTGVHNRKYFFSVGAEEYAKAKAKQLQISAAVIDLDQFNRVNDLVGNEGGDQVLCEVTRQLEETLDRFLFSRAGANAFNILMIGLSHEKAVEFVDHVRQAVSAMRFEIGEEIISTSCSGGVSSLSGGSLDEMIQYCVGSLKRAKEAGGNVVFGDD